MKTLITYTRSFISFLFLMLLTVHGFSQVGYTCSIKNITTVNSKTIRFDVFMESTGNSVLHLQALQAGINFNYGELANGGTITGSFVTGSTSSSLPEKQQAPNWKINPTSHQIQMLAAICQFASEAASIPSHSGGGIKLGTFEMKNTNDFSSGVTPEFTWSFSSGSVSTTKTVVTCYVNDAERGSNITNTASHTIVR